LDASGKAVAAGVALLLLIPLVSLSQDPATVNHDVSWTLYAGERLLDGAEYGVDVIELNPPLILWIGSLVAGGARVVGIPPTLFYNLLVLAGVLLGSLAIYRILLARFHHPALPFVLALALIPLQIFICDYDYGQRDHLIFLLMTPQILIAALSPGGEQSTRRARLLAGGAMALAISLKPHYALVWLATELASALWARQPRVLWREANWLIAGLGALYLVSIALVTPQYFEMAREAMAVYSAYDVPVPLLSRRTAPILAAIVVLAALRPRGGAGWAGVCAALASATSFLCVYIQHKNYPYHYLPVYLFAMLAILLALAAKLDAATRLRDHGRTLAWTGMAISLALAGIFFVRGFERVEEDRRELGAMIESRGRGLPVLFFSSSVSAAFPVVPMSGARSASPYPCIWQIAGHYTEEELARTDFPYRSRQTMPPLERQVLTTVIDWMEREEPGLLFFDLKRYQQGFLWADFAWERYLQADPRFAPLMRHYQSIGPVGEYYALARVGEPAQP
jgi:hypothetical protein